MTAPEKCTKCGHRQHVPGNCAQAMLRVGYFCACGIPNTIAPTSATVDDPWGLKDIPLENWEDSHD